LLAISELTIFSTLAGKGLIGDNALVVIHVIPFADLTIFSIARSVGLNAV